MNRYEKNLLIAMTLGDGSIKTAHRFKQDGSPGKSQFVFSVTHTRVQEPFIRHKAKLVGKIFNQKEPNVNMYTSSTSYGVVTYFKFSKTHKYFKLLRHWLYPNNKKFISRSILNRLSPEGIAIWYMDDGGLSKNITYVDKDKTKIKASTCEMRFSTYFSEEEADQFMSYFFDTWGLVAKKRFCKKTGTYYMAFNATNSRKLEELIGEYIIPSMQYKLPSSWIPRALDSADADDDIV